MTGSPSIPALKTAVLVILLAMAGLPPSSPSSGDAHPSIAKPGLPSVDPQVCYLVADNDGQAVTRDVLTMLDPSTGVETVVGVTGTDFVESIAYSPFHSTLFAVDGGDVGYLNLFSGKFMDLGKIGHGIGALGDRTFSDIDGLTVDPTTGVLLASVRQVSDNLLVQINPSTGSVVDHAFGITYDYVPIAPVPEGMFVDDIAVNPFDGLLYGVITDSSSSHLITINRVTGAVSPVTEIQAIEVEGLTFDSEGILYGTRGSSGRSVIKIDTSTGAVEDIFALGVDGNYDYESIDCVTEGTRPLPDFSPSDTRAPGDVRVEGAYPVPADATVTLKVKFTKTLSASLEIFDVLGKRVLIEPSRVFEAGVYDVAIETVNLKPGTYNYRWSTRVQEAYGDFFVVR